MKCPNCGAELSEDSMFCSYCGSKIEDVISDESDKLSNAESNEQRTVQITNAVTPKANNVSMGKTKKKVTTSKNKRDLYGKILIAFIIVFGIFCAVAFLLDNTAAEIVSVLQIVLIIVSIIMYKRIESAKKWFNIIPFILALLLSVIYALIVAADYDNSQKIVWSDLALNELVPEPQSLYGKIVSDSENSMVVKINRMSESQYNDYVEACKDYGFTVDPEEISHSFFAYDADGNELSLSYYSSSESIHITVNVAEEYGDFEWPDSGLACLLPVPESLTGEVLNNDESWFRVYVSEIPLESYNEYVNACVESGFSVETNEQEKSFSAQNSDGYRLSVSYEGNSVICISLKEPEYDVTLEVRCVANLIFSKYDVEVYIDSSHLGTVEHGTTETFTKSLTKGTYEVKFVDSDDEDVLGAVNIEVQQEEMFRYKISCTSSEITVKTVTDTVETETESQEISEITQDDSEVTETTAETEMFVIETESESETQVKETESETITEETEKGSSISDTQIKENDSVNETEKNENDTITYSTNTLDTVGNGNSGIYAYKSSGGSYYTYWIIDFDEGYVYTF